MGRKPAGPPQQRRQAVDAIFASTVRDLKAIGFVSHKSIMDELKRRNAPTERGGCWHLTTVTRMLKRLGMEKVIDRESGPGPALHRAAVIRAEALQPIILEIRSTGIVTQRGIALALNTRRMSGPNGGRWHQSSVHRLLRRLDRLKASAAYTSQKPGP
jgi:hypothetical protein